MDVLHFEDFAVGETIEYGATTVTADEIKEFARQFDPQVFHLDEAAARATMTGGLIASGWHTAAMMMRMSCDHFINHSSCQGAPGVDEISWARPVRPGDVLSVRRTTLSARPSKSRPELGLVEFTFDVLNQVSDVVMTQRNTILFRRRTAKVEADK